MHVGSNGKRSKIEAMYCPARTATYGDGNTSDLVLDCGVTVSFTEPFIYLGSPLHYDLSDHHDAEARVKKASKAFGAMRSKPPTFPSGSRERCTRAASWRSCCTAASRGASRKSRCGGWESAKGVLLFAASSGLVWG